MILLVEVHDQGIEKKLAATDEAFFDRYNSEVPSESDCEDLGALGTT